MAVTISETTQLSDTTVRVRWTSSLGTPSYRLFQDGALITTTELEEFTFSLELGHNSFIEILDDVTAIPAEVFTGYAILGWHASGTATAYRMEEKIASVWTPRQTIESDGQGYFNWRSRWLEDVTTHEFRVVPIAASGAEGTPLPLSIPIRRHPDIPDVSMVYASGTGKVTLAAA